MSRYIIPIIEKQKEQQKSGQIPLYIDPLPEVGRRDLEPKKESLNNKRGSVVVDFDIDKEQEDDW